MKKTINKTLILHDGEYKQYHEDIYEETIIDSPIFTTTDENFDYFISGNQDTVYSNLSKGTFWSKNMSNNVAGIAYFGIKLRKPEKLKTFIFRQGSSVNNSIPSINIQVSNNETTWTTLFSLSLSSDRRKKHI
ncbi:discoidin domain-containing protein [Lysinibacillus sp. NPDC093692]|uniref:discoidin domain-containing protein n=1 Tax=Lysinibacillus sp. NPDC093692 TaxID=3390578 RepID=UPI003CFEEC62